MGGSRPPNPSCLLTWQHNSCHILETKHFSTMVHRRKKKSTVKKMIFFYSECFETYVELFISFFRGGVCQSTMRTDPQHQSVNTEHKKLYPCCLHKVNEQWPEDHTRYRFKRLNVTDITWHIVGSRMHKLVKNGSDFSLRILWWVSGIIGCIKWYYSWIIIKI